MMCKNANLACEANAVPRRHPNNSRNTLRPELQQCCSQDNKEYAIMLLYRREKVDTIL